MSAGSRLKKFVALFRRRETAAAAAVDAGHGISRPLQHRRVATTDPLAVWGSGRKKGHLAPTAGLGPVSSPDVTPPWFRQPSVGPASPHTSPAFPPHVSGVTGPSPESSPTTTVTTWRFGIGRHSPVSAPPRPRVTTAQHPRARCQKIVSSGTAGLNWNTMVVRLLSALGDQSGGGGAGTEGGDHALDDIEAWLRARDHRRRSGRQTRFHGSTGDIEDEARLLAVIAQSRKVIQEESLKFHRLSCSMSRCSGGDSRPRLGTRRKSLRVSAPSEGSLSLLAMASYGGVWTSRATRARSSFLTMDEDNTTRLEPQSSCSRMVGPCPLLPVLENIPSPNAPNTHPHYVATDRGLALDPLRAGAKSHATLVLDEPPSPTSLRSRPATVSVTAVTSRAVARPATARAALEALPAERQHKLLKYHRHQVRPRANTQRPANCSSTAAGLDLRMLLVPSAAGLGGMGRDVQLRHSHRGRTTSGSSSGTRSNSCPPPVGGGLPPSGRILGNFRGQIVMATNQNGGIFMEDKPLISPLGDADVVADTGTEATDGSLLQSSVRKPSKIGTVLSVEDEERLRQDKSRSLTTAGAEAVTMAESATGVSPMRETVVRAVRPALTLPLGPRGVCDFAEFGYAEQQLLNEGSYGPLYIVRRESEGDTARLWVAKVVELQRFSDPSEAGQALLEAELLRRLHHPNIVEHRASFLTDTALIIVMEFCALGDLHSYLRSLRDRQESVDEAQVCRWLRDVAAGLHHMHKKNILHCDVKSSNIFLDHHKVAKIGDLGIARELRRGSSTLSPTRCPRGTPVYMSPEMCRRAALTQSSDCWSLGCIVFEMCHLHHAFPSQLRPEDRTRGHSRNGAEDDDRSSVSTFLPGITAESNMSFLGSRLLSNLKSDLKRLKQMASRQGTITVGGECSGLLPFWTIRGGEEEDATLFTLPRILPSQYSPVLNYLVCAMLEPKPADRPSLETIIAVMDELILDT